MAPLPDATADPLATAARVAIGSSIVFTYPLAFTGLRDGVTALCSVPDSARTGLTAALLGAVTALALVVRDVGFVNNLGGSIFGCVPHPPRECVARCDQCKPVLPLMSHTC